MILSHQKGAWELSAFRMEEQRFSPKGIKFWGECLPLF